MKSIILIGLLLCLGACVSSHPPSTSWADEAAANFAQTMGSLEPVLCHVVYYDELAECSIKVNDRVYPLYCHPETSHSLSYCVQALK